MPARTGRDTSLPAASAAIVIALLAGMAAELQAIVPAELLTVLVGLAVLGVLTHAIRQIAASDLVLGPVLAFAIALSDLTLLGLGRFFWALVIGLGTSLLVERDAWPDLTRRRRSAG
ncbi:MAG: benzoate/H(+) symporter BenE family transporter [Actinobacteria bacterium]|nr:benzoate/H(+) symporter BenE family transporter [Actinomycetota bacterium]